MVKGKEIEMTKAFWKDKEIFEIDYHSHSGWCEILFWDNNSPITGTGRYRVRLEDIEIRRQHD